ncbi:DUF2785 domain-containing protein [Aliiglaciecola sp. CAU 1673]|uniref:DUF2785 domain-containing protein n=1 Tax=Aliiglaciecola sp. CAU 1673 TaxID=3032595 RepID=UPI0023DA95CB|nr:DUF2785 domain-containing protein [Aliiglaciecola sp. CAU 1673]MDF2180094.1 DUF2785 domain-containing protein [Aliiglaciecola sp. CAU 1673]
MKQLVVLLVVLAVQVLSSFSWAEAALGEQCLQKPWDREALLDLKESKFEVEGEGISKLAMQLRDCLASSDPVIRDEIAYQAYFTWLRGDKLDQPTKLALFYTLLADLSNDRQDQHGVYLPFAMLVMSELAAADRTNSFLSDMQRQALIGSSIEYFSRLRDYRGFDDSLGWRHGIAHTADVFLQLTANPVLTQSQVLEIREAIRQQLRPTVPHFYIYGEPDRMAMPILYAMMREDIAVENWQEWLVNISKPAPLKSWQQAFFSQQGLADRHNIKSFLTSLYVFIDTSKNERLLPFKPVIEQQIRSLF